MKCKKLLKMTQIPLNVFLILACVSFARSSTLPEIDLSSDSSVEIMPPSLSASPLRVDTPTFIPTASIFLPESVSELPADPSDLGQETSDTERTPLASAEINAPEPTNWDILAAEAEEMDTESAPTITPEDVIQEAPAAIPIETYVASDRRPKSEHLPVAPTASSNAGRDQFLPDTVALDSAMKNLTSDPEDLENALVNETTQGGSSSSSSAEDIDQSKEASGESAVVTENDFLTKQSLHQSEEQTTTIITTTTTTTTTPSPAVVVHHPPPPPPKKKQPKYIKKFRASASEVLRYFMEDSYLRSPLAVLVDTSDQTLHKTKILWNATLQQSNANIDMVLATFAHSGIYGTYKFNNVRTLVAGLNSIQSSADTDHEVHTHTDDVFSTIIRASDHIPYDSAIFLFTSTEPVEDKVANKAALVLLKKRIRLYLFWFGGVDTDLESAAATNHRNPQQPGRDVAGKLGDVALRTGGEIVYMAKETIHANGEVGTVTLQLRNSFQGVHQPFGEAVTDSETNSVNRSQESSEEARMVGEETSLNVNANPKSYNNNNNNRDRSNDGSSTLKGGS